VCWWCCTDWRSSAPRCHVTQARIAATRAITPRITAVVIATIQSNMAASGYPGLAVPLPRTAPRHDSGAPPQREGPFTTDARFAAFPGATATAGPGRRQDWGKAGNAESGGAGRGGSRRANAAAIEGARRSAFTCSIRSVRSWNSGMTSRAKSSRDSQMSS